jgi:hypothetical protein
MRELSFATVSTASADRSTKMSKTFSQSLVRSAVKNSLLISSFLLAGTAFADCGQAKLVEAGSHSVSVTKNDCADSSRISSGATLELAPGSRMWLKFDPAANGETVQLICQNKTADAVHVNFSGAAEPWIKADGVKECSKWSNNKLSCESQSGEKNSFFCAVAKAKPEAPASSAPKMTTSVKMRGFGIPVTLSADDVIKDIQPEIELCKSLYNVTDKVEMGWTVSVGKIQDLNIQSDNRDFVGCVEEVVKAANADQDLSIKHAF